MTFKINAEGVISFSIGGGWGSEIKKENHSEVRIIRGTDIPKILNGDYSTIPIRFESDRKLKNRLLQVGDIVLETAGGSAANGQFTGRTLLVTQELLQELGPTICASFCKRLVLDFNLVDPAYFYFYMQDLYKSGRVAEYDSQSTGISNFQFESFLQNEVLDLPPLDKQVRIASNLKQLENLHLFNIRLMKNIEHIAQTLFKSWFVDFDPVHAKARGEKPVGMDDETAALFPDSFEDSELGLIPSGWLTQRADEIFDISIGRTPPRKQPEWFTTPPSGVPWVSIKDMGNFSAFSGETSETLTEDAIQIHRVPIVSKGTVLMSFKLTVGRIAIASESLATNEAIAHFRQNEASPLSPEYAYLWLKNLNFDDLDSTSSIATATNSSFIKAIQFLVPDSRVCEYFLHLAKPLFESILNLQKQIETLEDIRDALLPRLISGELEIPEELL